MRHFSGKFSAVCAGTARTSKDIDEIGVGRIDVNCRLDTALKRASGGANVKMFAPPLQSHGRWATSPRRPLQDVRANPFPRTTSCSISTFTASRPRHGKRAFLPTSRPPSWRCCWQAPRRLQAQDHGPGGGHRQWHRGPPERPRRRRGGGRAIAADVAGPKAGLSRPVHRRHAAAGQGRGGQEDRRQRRVQAQDGLRPQQAADGNAAAIGRQGGTDRRGHAQGL